jgi:PPK2 family polyphosphate:nucleotide phosphotransferase
MKIEIRPFEVKEKEDVSLAKRPTRVDPLYESKADYAKALEKHAEELAALHDRLYAASRSALLIVLQGMDSAGKDGAIKHVMTGVNPQGCKVVSFKTPTPLESRHDFLWREWIELPERGSIAVFNRSYYEAVLIERVHPEFLASEGAAVAPHDVDALFDERMRSIRHFERHLTLNGTTIVKIFLHISKDEQRQRLLARVEDPAKAWKATPNDVKERKFWKDYQHAYEAALGATSAPHAPWHVVPADDKKNARLLVSEIIMAALRRLPLDLPPITPERERELKEIRAALEG